jgi:uncharacterized protein
MNETPFFFGNQGEQLFGVYHAPEGPPRTAFVLCHPFGEEKLWAHRVFVSFSRRLAAEGHAVLRFDHRGNGDSDGEFRTTSIQSALEDIDTAIEVLKARAGVASVTIAGLRLGGTLAATASERRTDVNRLVLWAPIVSGASYLQELLRINLSTQLAVYREVREDREALGRRLSAGESVNVDGYQMGQAFAHQLGDLTLLGAPATFGGPCFIAQIERAPNARPSKDLEQLRGRYQAGELVVVKEEPFWKEIAKFYEAAPNLFATTLAWMNDGTAVATT